MEMDEAWLRSKQLPASKKLPTQRKTKGKESELEIP